MADCARCGHHEGNHHSAASGKWCDKADCRCDGYAARPEITRDMLLSEIRRSLEATHPERSGALMAALERMLPKPRPEAWNVEITINGVNIVASDLVPLGEIMLLEDLRPPRPR